MSDFAQHSMASQQLASSDVPVSSKMLELSVSKDFLISVGGELVIMRGSLGIDLSVVKDHPDRMTILPLAEIIKIMYRHCIERHSDLVDIKFSHRVVDLGQGRWEGLG